MTPDLLKTLLLFAVQLTGYPMPAQVPELQFVEREWLYTVACHGRPCSVKGLYTGVGIIFLDRSFQDDASALTRSVVVHEMVHYLQHLSRNSSMDCESATNREREAYKVQSIYLNQEDANIGLLLPRLYCSEPPSTGGGRPPVTATVGGL